MLKTLQVSNLYKSFDGHAILKNISFSAREGDVIVLIGSSGSGKSTLLRCINLLVIPDQGVIQIDENSMHFPFKTPLTHQAITLLRLKIGMVFQQFNLWPHMTVLENLIVAPVHILKQSKATAMLQAKQLLARINLEHKANSMPTQLSGGQQQRVAIIRALMMHPEIMLFDEPTSALDAEMVGEVLLVMKQLAAEGITMIIATHELDLARYIANQCLFLDHGEIVEQGEPMTMFTAPRTERFRQFLSAMQHWKK